MKKGFAYVMVLCACGGTGDTIIDGGDSDSGTGGDVATNDVTTNDVTSNDVTTNDVVQQDAPADVAPFNPANVSGLVLWLEADIQSSITLATPDSGPQKVTKWADQTVHANHALGLSQFFGRNPSVKASAINKLPAVHFDQGVQNQTSGQMLFINDNTDLSLQWERATSSSRSSATSTTTRRTQRAAASGASSRRRRSRAGSSSRPSVCISTATSLARRSTRARG